MWVYFIIIIFAIFALYKERQALGCPNIPNGCDCDNENGKAVKGTLPSPTDSNEEIYDKIKLAANVEERFVKWRVYFIISIVVSLLLWFVVYRRMPKEYEMVVSIIVIMLCLTLANKFYQFHLYRYIKKNIDASVDILDKRCP